jgi:tellurite methyltransferase
MERPIIAFGHDSEGEPIAVLSCGHPQHVRHNPPFINRPWVTSEEGRNGMIGQMLNCVRCDKFELPANFVLYKRTSAFTEESLPLGLRKDHSTKTGVWGKIVVEEGRLRYRVGPLHVDVELSPGNGGVVIPEVLHSVEPLGPVRFFVEFYRAPDESAPASPASPG